MMEWPTPGFSVLFVASFPLPFHCRSARKLSCHFSLLPPHLMFPLSLIQTPSSLSHLIHFNRALLRASSGSRNEDFGSHVCQGLIPCVPILNLLKWASPGDTKSKCVKRAWPWIPWTFCSNPSLVQGPQKSLLTFRRGRS